MEETAADLADNINPRVPVRQWVLSFPIPLRSLFGVNLQPGGNSMNCLDCQIAVGRQLRLQVVSTHSRNQ